jgi:hypothetical protein
MREFFPDDIQQEQLVAEMHKLTRKNFINAIIFILVGGAILGALGYGIAYVIGSAERSAEGGTSLIGWFILAIILFVVGSSVFSVLYGFWLILYGAYSKIRMFENYRFYICKVVSKKIEVSAASARQRQQRERYAKKHGKGTFYNPQGMFQLFLFYNDMQGKKRRIVVEDYFYNQVKVGGEFIIAKSRGGKLLLPDIFNTGGE